MKKIIKQKTNAAVVRLQSFHDTHKKHYLSMSVLFFGLVILCMSGDAFADDAVVASANLDPIYTKITKALSGTFGKILMGVGIILSCMAGIAGMSKVIIATPVGVGFIAANAKTIIDYVF